MNKYSRLLLHHKFSEAQLIPVLEEELHQIHEAILSLETRTKTNDILCAQEFNRAHKCCEEILEHLRFAKARLDKGDN